MITEIAQIIPPQLRARLIVAGQNHDTDAIDEVVKDARAMYPELFRRDFADHLDGPKEVRRVHE